MTTTTRRPPGGKSRNPAPRAPARPSRPVEKPLEKKDSPAATRAKARPRPAPQAESRRPAPPRAPFVLLICGLLGGALVSLLLLNTVLAEDAFTLTRLKQNNQLLEQQSQQLHGEIAREESPERLQQKAEAQGMVPGVPAYIDSLTGKTYGSKIRPVPQAAAAAAGAAGVVGIPGAVVPGDSVPTAPGAADPETENGTP
ncbi:hypothetical protein [Spirillospora sp. CA-294931]|uniref:hypothetical protein n=1 Tax=Spirillospora sp. CA-294931 TaxID=3240042 RepID=UPI003D8E979C